MAFLHIDTHAGRGRALKERFDGFLSGLKAGFEAYAERRGRFAEIERLRAKTDEELAAMGLTRERIVHHVFRDKFHF